MFLLSDSVLGFVLVIVVTVALERIAIRLVRIGNLGRGGVSWIVLAVGLPVIGLDLAPLFTAGLTFAGVIMLLVDIRKSSTQAR